MRDPQGETLAAWVRHLWLNDNGTALGEVVIATRVGPHGEGLSYLRGHPGAAEDLGYVLAACTSALESVEGSAAQQASFLEDLVNSPHPGESSPPTKFTSPFDIHVAEQLLIQVREGRLDLARAIHRLTMSELPASVRRVVTDGIVSTWFAE